jgi:hypothetical protein
VNLTRITIIVSLPSNLGSPSKKSIEISFQILSSVAKCCKSPGIGRTLERFDVNLLCS